jgi:hypothetical protein
MEFVYSEKGLKSKGFLSDSVSGDGAVHLERVIEYRGGECAPTFESGFG